MFLNLEDDDSFVSIYKVGIVTANADYKLSLALNRAFSISLSCVNPVTAREPQMADLLFSRFRYISSSGDTVFNLVANRCGGGSLIKKLKNIDYLLVIHTTQNHFNIDELITQLRTFEGVTAVFNLGDFLSKKG